MPPGGQPPPAALQIYGEVAGIYHQLCEVRNNGDSGGALWKAICAASRNLDASVSNLPQSPLLHEGIGDLQAVLPQIYDKATMPPIPTPHEFMAWMDDRLQPSLEEISTALETLGGPGLAQLHAVQLLGCTQSATEQLMNVWTAGGDPQGELREQMDALLQKMGDAAQNFPAPLDDLASTFQAAVEKGFDYAASTPAPTRDELTGYLQHSLTPLSREIAGALMTLGYSI